MLNLNRSKTEYRVKMYWFKLKKARNGVMTFEPQGKPFSCSFTISQDSTYISDGQGLIYNHLIIETVADYPFNKNDKISYLGHDYIIQSVDTDLNSITGSDYTNRPSSIVKYIDVEG